MEEEYENEIRSLVDTLYRVHRDNASLQFFAKDKRRHEISMMPITPFVYEFFLFNSLYQVDWNKSCGEKLMFHPSEDSESKQQREFIKYIKVYAKSNPAALYRAFEPLKFFKITDASWTRIVQDGRISQEEGKRFFENIKSLQEYLESCSHKEEMPVSKKVFKILDACVYFVYMVRNNIFHGSKTLGEIYDRDQKRRIEVYEVFLKGVTSLFFLSRGKTPVASDLILCPVISENSSGKESEVLDMNAVWMAFNRDFMKAGDTRLISQFTKYLTPPKQKPEDNSVLFYPSAGSDMLTPLLLGLPYCTDFYFYERGRRVEEPPRINMILKNIPMIQFESSAGRSVWSKMGHEHFFDFAYDGIRRRVHWVHSDNLEFLKLDVKLTFYFHRGDSQGEGGSDQKWDSKLLVELRKMIPEGHQCPFLTDGEPGGVDLSQTIQCHELSVPFIERERKYYCGYF